MIQAGKNAPLSLEGTSYNPHSQQEQTERTASPKVPLEHALNRVKKISEIDSLVSISNVNKMCAMFDM